MVGGYGSERELIRGECARSTRTSMCPGPNAGCSSNVMGGGTPAGEVASQVAVETILEQLEPRRGHDAEAHTAALEFCSSKQLAAPQAMPDAEAV
jgi:hypothetical protein